MSRKPVSLLNLPDELIVDIFQRLFRIDCARTRYCDRPSQITVNKRIYRLCLPTWSSSLFVPERLKNRTTFLADLLLRPDAGARITALTMCIPSDPSQLYCAAAASLSNLTFLSVSLGRFHGTYPLHFNLLVRRLPRLEHLVVAEDGKLEDKELLLERDLPSLRILETGNADLLRQLFRQPAQPLRCLKMVKKDEPEEGLCIPWAGVEHLDLSLNVEYEGSEMFVQTLTEVHEAQPPTALWPLRRLTLRWRVLEPRLQHAERTGRSFEHFHTMLAHLQLSQLEELDLLAVPSLSHVPIDTNIPSVRILRLMGDCKLYEEQNLRNLHNFLANFPSLTSLQVTDFDLDSANSASVSALAKPSRFPLPIRFPILHALLAYLSASSILDFRYRTTRQQREMRWTRRTVQDEFEQEVWWVGE